MNYWEKTKLYYKDMFRDVINPIDYKTDEWKGSSLAFLHRYLGFSVMITLVAFNNLSVMDFVLYFATVDIYYSVFDKRYSLPKGILYTIGVITLWMVIFFV